MARVLLFLTAMAIRRRWKVLIGLALGVTAAVGIVVTAGRIPFSSDTLRARLVQSLSERLESDVELDALSLRLLPSVHASGAGLRIHHKGRRDVPPLIAVQSFAVSASLSGLWARRVDRVVLNGLDIHIPPRDDRDQPREPNQAQAPPAPEASQPPAVPDEETGAFDARTYARQVVITEVNAPEARLVIMRREPTKPARTWSMHALTLREVGLNTAMPFESTLTNAVPPGEIQTSGHFGPWNRDEPGETPLDGVFTFDNADLGVFKGISGTLSAKGSFGGALERIVVDGQTDTPNFAIDISGHPLPLTTTYHAIVDGTNGNTTLDPVHATFLGTSLTARGGVYEKENVNGRIVSLEVEMDGGRMEDVMRLAVSTPRPPMSGQLHLKTTLVIPPGKVDVVDKLQLDGRFKIERGRFTDADVQNKINELSRRASGKMDEMPVARRVTSDFTGRFKLGRGTMAIPKVTFDIPGAVVEMGGTYGMRSGSIDFNGSLFMDAKISETVTGFKSLLLKLADPLFRRDGRTVVPLRVNGTRSDPKFGLDMKRVLRRGDDGAKKPPAARQR